MEKITFKKPYKFEDTVYEDVDLSGLEDLSGKDLIAVQRMISKSTIMPELDYQYTLMIAAKATGLPIEFFSGLPAPEAVKIKTVVSGFLYSGD